MCELSCHVIQGTGAQHGRTQHGRTHHHLLTSQAPLGPPPQIKLLDDDPFAIVQFHCQQLKCTRDKFGNVVDGATDSIQRVYYFWGVQQVCCAGKMTRVHARLGRGSCFLPQGEDLPNPCPPSALRYQRSPESQCPRVCAHRPETLLISACTAAMCAGEGGRGAAGWAVHPPTLGDSRHDVAEHARPRLISPGAHGLLALSAKTVRAGPWIERLPQARVDLGRPDLGARTQAPGSITRDEGFCAEQAVWCIHQPRRVVHTDT